MLRIGIVSQAYRPAVGGVTEHVAATARVLRLRGHDVTVITSRFGSENESEGGVVRLGRNLLVRYNGAENNMTVGMRLPAHLDQVLRAGRFDVVHIHCPVSPVLPLLTLRLARCPVVGTFHSAVMSDLPFQLFGRFLLPLYRRIDRPLAVSDTARECAERHFPGPIEVVPNGVDRSRFRPGLPRLARYDDDLPTILFVGRFDPRKGIPELMAACGRLAREGHRFRLVLVGDGALRSQITRLAGGALEGRVHFEGHVGHDHLPRYYASADIFCSPARGGESFGLVLLEAMASGVPVVATDLPGHRSVFTPGVEGITVPPRDPGALAVALARLLADASLRASMGALGVERARAFGWERIVDRLESMYRSLAPERDGAAARFPELVLSERLTEAETAAR